MTKRLSQQQNVAYIVNTKSFGDTERLPSQQSRESTNDIVEVI